MARISSTNISFSPTEGNDELSSWKKARQEYVRTLGHYLLICSESDIIQIFDNWENQIHELGRADKFYNYLTALMTISLLHYFNRSYDQIKEHVPFITKMLQHKSRTINHAAALVFKYLASELSENVEFLRDIVTKYASSWIEMPSSRYTAMLILRNAGGFILPNVFAVTSNKFQLLWEYATGDDLGIRTNAAKVIDTHLSGLPIATQSTFVNSLFQECLKSFKVLNPNNHGPVLICGSIIRRFSDIIDVPLLINALMDVIYMKNEMLDYSAFNLLYKISKKLNHLFTPDTVRSLFTKLIVCCQKYINSQRLFKLINKFIKQFNTLLVPVQSILDFLKIIVKTPKYRVQQKLAFVILQNIFSEFKDVVVPASFFLDADPSPQYIEALRMRMGLFNELKSTLLKCYTDGIGPKTTKSQNVLSLHILKAFDSHLFMNKEKIFNQVHVFTRSQDEEVRLLVTEVLPLFSNQAALDDLLFLALFDESKNVRASAVEQLQYPSRLAHCEMLPQILDDPSFKVRRNAIPLIAKVAPLNPMLFIVPISSFIQHSILSMASSSNPYECAKISSLMSLIAEHFIPFCPAFIPQVTKICFNFLNISNDVENIFDGNKNQFNKNENKNDNLNKDKININNVVHRDMSHDGHALISNKLPFDKSCTNLLRIFQIENQEWIDNRDANLFLTIKKLAPQLSLFINDFVPIFINVLSSQRSDRVFSSAIDSLTEIVIKLQQAADIPTTHPLLMPILMIVLKNHPSEEVSIKILKLIGTLGVTSFPSSLVEKPTESDPITEFDFKSPSFYTDFIMTALLKPLSEPHSSIFEVVTSVFVKEADIASKFLGTIVDAFSKSLMISKGLQKDTLFNQLEIISYFAASKIEPYVHIIIPHIMANIDHTAAVKLAFVLSYYLKTEFIPSVQPLFQTAIRVLHKMPEDTKYNEILLKFLASSIIFQNQPIDLFVSACENALLTVNDPDRMTLIVDALISIVQLGDASFECAHITRVCIRLMRTNIRSYVFQLLFSLSVYCNLSPDVIDFISNEENISNPSVNTLRDYLNNHFVPIETFLSKRPISVSIQIPDYVPLSNPSTPSVFSNFPPPQFSNTEKWLEDLCSAVVAESPSIAIRACHKIVQHSPSFRSEVFPIAFLSCWRAAPQSDMKKFSTMIRQIFEGENPINPTFLRLAELLVRAGTPLNISNFVIAKACQSPAMALRFLVRHFTENPTDYNAVELMLTLNMRLGRIESSTGILKTVKLPTAGTWWEKLGDWESALKIYKKNGADASSIIRCYAKLEQWEAIREMVHEYDSMTNEEKKENAVWFAWAFYRINDLQKVSYFVNKFEDSDDLNLMLFKEIFFVASDQTQKAKEFINKSLQMLVKDCSVYSALNASQADENLTYANYMVELEEALEYKENKNKEIVKRWRRRLQYHTGDSYSWMRLVEIRNLAVHPIENKKSYLKLMSVLGKERKYDMAKERRLELVNNFWGGMLSAIHEPSVQIAYHKLQWALEKKREATNSLHLLNMLYDTEITKEKFLNEFKQIYSSVKDVYVSFLTNNCPELLIINSNTEIDANKLFKYRETLWKKVIFTPKVRSRFYRIEGSFRAQLYQKNESLESLVQTLSLFEKACKLMPDDYRNWAGFAYAASRVGDRDEASIDIIDKAIHGFLKVTQLLTTNNLEYLCQLFSLFFRYGGKVNIPDELVNLGPEIINQILPQIVCQINHPVDSVRAVVHELLARFSENHFQALVFSLQLLIASVDKEKSAIASELFNKFGMKHSGLAEEAKILVDGLLRSAVTWYEKWMTLLDAAFIESRRDYMSGTNMLKKLFASAKHPKCAMDRTFIKMLESPLSTCNNTINHFMPTEASFNTLWTQLKRFYEIVRDKFKKMETIELITVSEALANHRNFQLAIPGKYEVNGNNPLIERIDPTLPILTTQQHPRLLYMFDNEGTRWKFLLKGNEDLRLDQRIMQFFNLINSLLMTNKLTSDLGLYISKYAIVPFAPNAGLISWVTGADTLHQLVMEYRKSNMKPVWIENEIVLKYTFERFDLLNALQKAEVWDLVSPMCNAMELHETFWERTPDAVSWLQCVDTFVLSTALMSMAGYVIGLGDRHPSNIMIQRQTGHVVHIDFGDSFEVALNRDRMPEKVPFRLTRMLINAFGVTGVEGVFRSTCEKIMHVIRDNKSSIIAQLEIFVHEPIFANKDNGHYTEGQSAILDRVIEKLSGKDPHIDPKQDDDNEVELNVEEQVDKLIQIASDPYRYVLHYIGWCQFW
ncbi:PIKK family atypical protein kinase [Tritrichomonas foetus]|uniref:Serine/threonine-protein kinase TOR n=1 Tax=Tritrichomonas foetus TaxID=1144522 RepID=A0A1J4KIQ2_9EUKA|nr:PIKK family atypical protein kinase [Tritrichomonas foetus]|eukprot:OHT11231.1 PIKK family atypical protein kinase [Tritrichomonas foetus]